VHQCQTDSVCSERVRLCYRLQDTSLYCSWARQSNQQPVHLGTWVYSRMNKIRAFTLLDHLTCTRSLSALCSVRAWLPFPAAGRSLQMKSCWIAVYHAVHSYWPRALPTKVPEHPLQSFPPPPHPSPASFLLRFSLPSFQAPFCSPKPCLFFREPFFGAPGLPFSQVVYV